MRPIRSPTLLPIRMNAADTSASSEIADWTPLTVVPRSLTTAEIDTFMIEVSTTSTNIAIASKMASRRSKEASGAGTPTFTVSVTAGPTNRTEMTSDRTPKHVAPSDRSARCT